MATTKTTRYDVAEHLRTPEEMAAYLEACLDEPGADAAFIAKAIGDRAERLVLPVHIQISSPERAERCQALRRAGKDACANYRSE